LKQLVDTAGQDLIRFSADFAADPASLLESARALGMEGIMAKRADAPYSSDRTTSWLKLKATGRQEFIVGGFTDREGSSREVGALMLGYRDENGTLQYAGNVGTGWNSDTAVDLRKRLQDLRTTASPFVAEAAGSKRWARRTTAPQHWVQPTLVVEVSFADWTPDGHVRHAVFRGLRSDKPADAVTREPVAAASDVSPGAKGSPKNNVKVSNPQRVIDPSTGLTKLDLVRFYESIADWMLPHLKGRPVSLVRGPSGITGELFFQKHDDKLTIPGLRQLDPALWPGHPPLIEVPTAQALVQAAQMNVVEFHTWNALAKRIEQPDRIVFDLDPGEGVAWSRVQEAATLTHEMLRELGLDAWLKTSGGKGLHVVVPIAPKFEHDVVKDFSQTVVQHLARVIPSRFVAKSGAANRVGKVFVDYLRNTRGATTAAAFSARARPGLGVSMPVSWEQLPALKSGSQWTISTAREYLSFQKTDPWADYWTRRQTLTQAMKILGFEPTPKQPSVAKKRLSR